MIDYRFFYRLFKYFFTFMKYRLLGYCIGKYFMVGRCVNISRSGFKSGDCVYIGQYSYIGPNVKLGNFCLISDNVNFIGKDHNFNSVGVPIILSGKPEFIKITIVGDDVWIGHAVTVMRGVTIGEGSIVAANSVVTKNIEPYSIVAGVPAVKIGSRFTSDEQIKHSFFLSQYRSGKFKLLHDRNFVVKHK